MSKELKEWQTYIKGCEHIIAETRDLAKSILDKRSKEVIYPQPSKWTRLWSSILNADAVTRVRYFDSREAEVFGTVMKGALYEERYTPNIQIIEREWERKRPSVSVYLLADSELLTDFTIDSKSNNPYSSFGYCHCFLHELAGRPIDLANFLPTRCGWDSIILVTACMDSIDNYLDIYNKWN